MDNNGLLPALSGGVLAVTIVFSVAILVAMCYFVWNVAKALPEKYQKRPANQVWLLLIPCFNIVWNFFVYPVISDSYAAYFAAEKPGETVDINRNLALAVCILPICSIIPLIGMFASLAFLVVWIIWIVKMHGLKSKISA